MRPELVRPGGIPIVAALALIAIGLGLVGMTAGRLPGIAANLEAPRWFMGLVGGALVAAGLLAAHWLPRRIRVDAVLRGAAVAALGAVGAAFGHYNGTFLPEAVENGLNMLGRIAFPLGLGALIGWAAVEGSRHAGGARR